MGRRRLTRTQNLYREHSRLVEAMFVKRGGKLGRSDRHRLEMIREKLDDIEMSQMRPNIERMQKMVEESRRATEGIMRMLELVRPYLPPPVPGEPLPICEYPMVSYIVRNFDVPLTDYQRDQVRRIKQAHTMSADLVLPAPCPLGPGGEAQPGEDEDENG